MIYLVIHCPHGYDASVIKQKEGLCLLWHNPS